jgi:hypothetical protein
MRCVYLIRLVPPNAMFNPIDYQRIGSHMLQVQVQYLPHNDRKS